MLESREPVESERTSILHIAPYYPPDRIGGVGEVARYVHEGLVDLGYRSEVLASGTTTSDPAVHRVGKSPARFVLTSWRAVRLTLGFDVVHVHQGEAFLLLLILRLFRNRPRILVMFHVDVRRREAASDRHFVEGRRFGPSGVGRAIRRSTGWAKALVERIAWLCADSVTVETNCLREELSDLRPKRSISVVPYGLPPLPAFQSTRPEDTELLYVGTPGMRKRTHLLPLILRRTQDRRPDTRLRVVGFHPGDDPQLVGLAKELGVLDSIVFEGPLTSEQVEPFYHASQVLLLPSAYEGLPIVLLEAMRAGMLCVATDVSGHPDAIMEGVNGYLTPVDDVALMADTCVWALDNPELASGMGDRAQETVKVQFGIARQIRQYIRAYNSMLMPIDPKPVSEAVDGHDRQT